MSLTLTFRLTDIIERVRIIPKETTLYCSMSIMIMVGFRIKKQTKRKMQRLHCRALDRQMKKKQTVVSCLHTNAMTRAELRIWARETYSIYAE